MIDFIETIKGKVAALELVGSRVTCNPPPVDTDQDVLVLAYSKTIDDLIALLIKEGFDLDGSSIEDPSDYLCGPGDRFQSFSKSDLNLIVTANFEFYRKFLAATSVAKSLNLLNKEDRIALFQAVLYGNCDLRSE